MNLCLKSKRGVNMNHLWIILASVILVSLISLVGIAAVLVARKKLSKILIYLVALSAGTLFGGAFFHLLPEAAEGGFTISISLFAFLGIVVSFIVEKLIHWTHCHIMPSRTHIHRFAYMNIFGDGVHNFIDGIIIAVSYLVSIPLGIATTIAVIFHEIPQEIGDFGVLLLGGFTVRRALFLNFLSAITAIIGALFAFFVSSFVEGIMIPLIAFAAGNFIYIAGVDLVPELHKKFSTKSAILQLLIFILGAFIMYTLLFME
ncbi:MAG TPA: ZIP family metal transporter [archaeon]|nr:ZIP family metal transporter [archaeon]